MKLLVATTNSGKLKEYKELLADLPVEWVSLLEVGLGSMDVEETGSTFEENALLKARTYCAASGLITLADDSGIEVDALDGAPGIYSARYGAPEVTSDRGRLEKVLQEIKNVPDEQRTARFICVVAIALPNGEVHIAIGRWEGRLAHAPRGINGFGYDPIFITDDGRTSAELSPAEKNRISHRALALEAAHPYLNSIIKKMDV
jgi:XTP/dITP diphosphohydrolase